jgi:hypothetical protein
MADLLIDLQTLDDLVLALNKITWEFNNAKPVRPQLVAAVGDYENSASDGLAGNVDAFSKGWDIHRSQIQTTLTAVSSAVKAIHDTFISVDNDLAAALTQGT